MIVLAVETATDTAAVALADEGGLLASVVHAGGRRHAETVAPAVAEVCRRTGRSLADVDVLAVDVGPGLFAGLRVGVATAQGLALATGRPVVGVTSLEILAQGVVSAGEAGEGGLVVPVVDARRGQVFAARFRAAGGVAVGHGVPVARRPGELAAELAGAGEAVVVTGDGARRHAAALAAVPGVTVGGPAGGAPPVAVLAQMATARARVGAVVPGAAVVPCYLRPPDTRINWERRPPAGASAVSDGDR